MARRGERPPIGLTWVVTWPLSAVFAALVVLSAEELRHPQREVVVPPSAIGGADWRDSFPKRIAVVNAALRKAPLRLSEPVEEDRGSGPLRWTHRRYDVEVPRAEQGQTESVLAALQGVDPGLAASAVNTADGTDVRVGLDGLLVSTVRFRWNDAATPKPIRPRFTLVIGPLGDDLRVARQVVAIEAPVVLGVRPYRPFSREVAELGRLFNREVLIYEDCTAADDGAPRCGATREYVETLLTSVPNAVGVAWHGSTCKEPSSEVARELARRQLIFIGRCADRGDAAAALPAPAVIDAAAPEEVAAGFGAVIEQARRDGRGIAIGTPTETTLTMVTELMPTWQAADVELVALSALADSVTLSAR
jgi:polysaccharide deacetylase 2 family uncharacterized protein YibQ